MDEIVEEIEYKTPEYGTLCLKKGLIDRFHDLKKTRGQRTSDFFKNLIDTYETVTEEKPIK